MKAETQARHVLAGILREASRRVAEAAPGRGALERAAGEAPPAPDIRAALTGGESLAIIGEIKRRSPSAGVLRPEGEVAALGRSLREAGAAALSVLTEPAHFGGSLDDLAAVAGTAGVPVLRKDFILDEVQLLEARARGAAAALLIVRILDAGRLAALIARARSLGLEPLVEVHDHGELGVALDAGARVIGVNARDLDTLAMDPQRHAALLPEIPAGCIAVAESGLATREDLRRAAAWGADAVLVGAAVSGSADPAGALQALTGVRRGAARRGEGKRERA